MSHFDLSNKLKGVGPTIVLPKNSIDNISVLRDKTALNVNDSDTFLLRFANTFIEKYDREELQELLMCQSSNWLLSQDEFKFPIEQPAGIISDFSHESDLDDGLVILFPVLKFNKDPKIIEENPNDLSNIEKFDVREIHQIINELTHAIYVLNQIPSIQLHNVFDKSSSVSIPPAFYDTRIGNIMIEVDYMMKSIWHGSHFPYDKRIKFSERWRKSLDVNKYGVSHTKKSIVTEFINAGLVDISMDSDYKNVFETMFNESEVNNETDDDMEFFMKHVDHVSLILSFYQNSIRKYKNAYIIDPASTIDSKINLDMEDLNEFTYNRLNSRLQLQTHLLNNHLTDKRMIARKVHLLNLISFLTPCFINLRKRHYIPNIFNLLSKMSSEELKTERELPPLMLQKGFRVNNFKYKSYEYFNLHGGIQFDIETPEIQHINKSFNLFFNKLNKETSLFNEKLLEFQHQQKETANLPIVKFEGKLYYYFKIDMETFYMQSPQKPKWVNILSEELLIMKKKIFPMDDGQLHDYLKKIVNPKVTNIRNLSVALKLSTCRGIVSVFDSISHKLSTGRIAKMDDNGFSAMHYATMYNQPHIITKLILATVDINTKRSTGFGSDGATPLHLASGSGSVACVSCLLANYANILLNDNHGWTPIHYAAYYNNLPVIRLLLRSMDTLLEIQTKNSHKYTPLLLAATAGSMAVVELLCNYGASLNVVDGNGDGIIQLAALNIHTSIISLIMEKYESVLNVWNILIGKLMDAVVPLVKLLRHENFYICSVVLSVIKNISNEHEIRKIISATDISKCLIILLSSNNELIVSRAAVVMSDLATVAENRVIFARDGAVDLLPSLLISDVEEILSNVISAIKNLCIKNPKNQTKFIKNNVIEPLIEFLNVIHMIMLLSKSFNMKTQVKIAIAIEALAHNNPDSQKKFLECDTPKLLLLMMKKWSIEMKERSALAIWSLAGNKLSQKKYIASRIGTPQLIDMTLSTSQILHFISCLCMDALSQGDFENQIKIKNHDGIGPIIRLLKIHQNDSQLLLTTVIKLIGTLCLGVAHRSNYQTQSKIASENAIQILVKMMNSCENFNVKIEISHTLACIIMNNPTNQMFLRKKTNFNLFLLLNIVGSDEEETRMKAGLALANFAFNNTRLQDSIIKIGGIPMIHFEKFLTSSNELYKCKVAFMIVVLAKVIKGVNQIEITALGLKILVESLNGDDSVVLNAASLLSSLEHTRAGITDAILTLGAMDLLIPKLKSINEQIRSAVAICLGYMTFNRTASRKLLSYCRNSKFLYRKIMSNIGPDPKISKNFINEYEIAQKIGIPSLSLEINGGPPIRHSAYIKHHVKRPVTSISQYHKDVYTTKNTNQLSEKQKKRFIKSAPGINQL
ncbi:Ankyrin and armadillo repeat-containing protein [Intoshia linei]|uniref:Ankyrin and armadillo repeat-containing protein n=1 Tax=Intoshia linei TaxID=1819745 RepID=A0A177B610_9BILA|nr:Ankyrin and armadillo repeat-containing protein [Intoshia linei]